MTLTHWLMSILVIELIAVFVVAFLAFAGFFTDMRMLSKIGIFVMTTGLMVQVMRSLHYFEFGGQIAFGLASFCRNFTAGLDLFDIVN